MQNPDNWTMTVRRWEILGGIAAGMTDAEIAAKLFITENTVKTHVRMLLRMFKVKRRVHLVALCYQEGWMPVEQRDGWLVSDGLMFTVVQVFDALRGDRVSEARSLALKHGHRLPREDRIRRGERPRDPRPRPEEQMPLPDRHSSSDRT